MRKRIISLICCAALALLAPFTALAESSYTMAGFDGDSSSHTWEGNGFFTRMEQQTGVHFTFDEYTDYDKWQVAKQTMFTTGNLPDVLFKAELTTAEQITYSENGMLIDLKPLLEKDAPNLWALLQANPDWLKAITLPDGKIVALPSINPLDTQNAMWINTQWLKTLGLSMPTDWDSFVNVLQAFQMRDPNGNGKTDEIPLSFLGAWDLKFLAHAFGIVANDYNVYLDDANTVQFAPTEDRYIAFIQQLSNLYAQGLLASDGFSTADTLRVITDDDATVTYGVFFGPNPMNLLPYSLAQQYELLMPLTFEGQQIYRGLYSKVLGGAFAITSACQNPDAMLQWVDTLYTQDGAVLAMAGTQGEDYTLNADGTWDYAGGEENSSYVLYDLSIYDTGTMPWLFPQDFYNKYDNDELQQVNSELTQLQQYIVTPFPTDYTLTLAQESTLAPLQSALGRYVDESFAKFVTGEWDAQSDAAITAYRSGFADLGLDQFLAFWQNVADTLQ